MAEKSQVRVRFAPSPTGFLHVGGARTALFNWLYARSQGGTFLLRIEDTDRERSEDRFTADILASLEWLGFTPDEEPIYQSHRFDRYRALAQQLLAENKAYWCSCTPAELDAVRAQCEKEKKPFRYPGTCKEKKLVGGPGQVLRVANPKTGATPFTDLIRGPISFANSDLDDWVCLRADGAPTYNFTVVVDDHDQKVSHVLRGDDHINNTPKQILLYQAFGWTPPHFAHLPMILGTDKTKLSKRHGAASTLEYRRMGFLPDALVNFLVRLGWSHGDQEVFTRKELIEFFGLDKIGKAAAVFNPEKLQWLSGHYLRDTPAEELRSHVDKYFADESAFLRSVDTASVLTGIGMIQGKVKNLVELIEQLKVLFGADPSYDVTTLPAEDRQKLRGFLETARAAYGTLPFEAASLEAATRAIADKAGVKLTPVAQAVRYAMTGGKVSPGLFEMLVTMGKDRVLRRMDAALGALK